MIYVKKCPNCSEKVSFLDNEDEKKCKHCGEHVINDYKKTQIIPKKTSSNTKKIKP